MPMKVLAKRHILISVAGLTPQVITETLYHLTQLRSPPVTISEIFILTTSLGKEQLLSSLLDSRYGKYFKFLDDYNIPPSTIEFDASHILVLKDADGNELRDIRTNSDNESVADQILAFVREKAADENCCLHCSLAGGRKTMGLYLGFALQLYGKSGDTLSHVLVHPPELEMDKRFFYPPPENQPFQLQDGQILAPNQIKVELAEIPVLFLRRKISSLQDNTELGYSDLVHSTQKELEHLHSPMPLIINRTSCSFHIGEISISPTHLQFALYLFFAQRRLKGCDDADCRGCEQCFVSAEEFYNAETIDQLKATLQETGSRDPRHGKLSGWDGEFAIYRLRQERSKINRKINIATHSMLWTNLYQITKLSPSLGNEHHYGIPLNKRLIRIN